MPVDYGKMVEHVEKSKAELDKAMAEFSQIDRMTITESYVMGHVRSGLAVLNSARDFILQTAAYKEQVKKGKSKPDEPVKPAAS